MENYLPKKRQRSVVYAKDVARLICKSERTAQRLLEKIRCKLGKPKGGVITVLEFCAFMGMMEKELLWIMT